MYFRKLTIKNAGPIEDFQYTFEFNEDSTPKPLILVGANGSGKSILLSYLVNPLMAAQQVAFDNTEVKKDFVYKLRSSQYIRAGAHFSHSRLEFEFGPTFDCHEWQLALPKEEYVTKFGRPEEFGSEFDKIPKGRTSSFTPLFAQSPSAVEEQFRKNCVLYFPANRFEQPAWLNEENLTATADFDDTSVLQRQTRRRIVQEAPLHATKNWLLDVLMDCYIHESKSHQTVYGPVITYHGRSTTIWEAANKAVRAILGTSAQGRLGIGARHQRNVSVMDGERELVSNIFQLSTGQTSLLNIALSIVRDFDMSGSPFESLADIQGVVIVDEIDAHMHSHMQCNVLPTLIRLFPKVQFVLTTHSPLFLLGMKTHNGERSFTVLRLPSGEPIEVEQFDEFRAAFEYYRLSDSYNKAIENTITQSQKPVIFVEGDYDVRYLQRAATLLKKEDILQRVQLHDANGCGGLKHIWNGYKSHIAIAMRRLVGLIYDCDVGIKNEDRDMVKRRVIPTIIGNPISKGIENLFPKVTIARLRNTHPYFFDITPAIEKKIRGKSEQQPEVCEVNKDEKRNVCDFMCENGTVEDFAAFGSVLEIISELVGESETAISAVEEQAEISVVSTDALEEESAVSIVTPTTGDQRTGNTDLNTRTEIAHETFGEHLAFNMFAGITSEEMKAVETRIDGTPPSEEIETEEGTT